MRTTVFKSSTGMKANAVFVSVAEEEQSASQGEVLPLVTWGMHCTSGEYEHYDGDDLPDI